MKTLFLLLPVLALLTGCYSTASYERYTAEQTAKLRKQFPPGTTKAEVQARWGKIKPDYSAMRPPAGWSTFTNKFVAEAVIKSETATGKTIALADSYMGPVGWTLCRYWYYYDSTDHIIDVEWDHCGD